MDNMKREILTILFCLACACTPAKAPTAHDLAVAAVVAVDTALAAAITADTSDAGVLPWGDYVDTVKQAAQIVESSQDLCPVLPALLNVATMSGCAVCGSQLVSVQEQLKCQ